MSRLKPNDFVKVEVEDLTPIPAGDNPFWHELFLMGTDLVRGWIIMHEGFDNPKSPLALNGVVLVNTRSGQRIRLDFSPKNG